MALAEKLIELVRKYPILYDLSHEDNKNVKKKDKAWIEIAEELNEDVDEMKKKWKNLRDTFLRYIKAKKGRNGKKWHWASLMESFNPSLSFVKTPPSEIPYKYRKQQVTETSSKIINIDPIATDTEYADELISDSAFVNFSKKSKSPPPYDSSDTACPTPPLSRKRKRKNKNQLKSTSTVDSLLKRSQNQRNTDLDEIDLLFLAHARNIKTFSKKRQAIAKMRVSHVIMEQELKNLEEQYPNILNHDEFGQTADCSPFSNDRGQPSSPTYLTPKIDD